MTSCLPSWWIRLVPHRIKRSEALTVSQCSVGDVRNVNLTEMGCILITDSPTKRLVTADLNCFKISLEAPTPSVLTMKVGSHPLSELPLLQRASSFAVHLCNSCTTAVFICQLAKMCWSTRIEVSWTNSMKLFD